MSARQRKMDIPLKRDCEKVFDKKSFNPNTKEKHQIRSITRQSTCPRLKPGSHLEISIKKTQYKHKIFNSQLGEVINVISIYYKIKKTCCSHPFGHSLPVIGSLHCCHITFTGLLVRVPIGQVKQFNSFFMEASHWNRKSDDLVHLERDRLVHVKEVVATVSPAAPNLCLCRVVGSTK